MSSNWGWVSWALAWFDCLCARASRIGRHSRPYVIPVEEDRSSCDQAADRLFPRYHDSTIGRHEPEGRRTDCQSVHQNTHGMR